MPGTTNNRILLDVELEPAIGQRFQPTGFPDLGPADYYVPDANGKDTSHSLLVESAQSMANRLEGTAWDPGTNQPVPAVEGLPYVRVLNADGEYLTSSRTEAHRLASAFIRHSTLDGKSMTELIAAQLGLRKDHPMDHRHIAHTLFALDPFVLVHGVFFSDSKMPGQPKITRALSSFIEAHDVRRAESGGVKRDHVLHKTKDEDKGDSTGGYGPVPFERTEWTARQIIASFSLDLMQLRSYGLSDQATDLLRDIALWEIRTLLDGGLRLRTACDLLPVAKEPGVYADRSKKPLPSADELASAVASGIKATAAEREGANVIDVVWAGPAQASKTKDS